MMMGTSSKLQAPMSTAQALNMSTSAATFLQSDMNINDPAVLRRRIAELEAENKRLKDSESSHGSTGKTTLRNNNPAASDKDWMNFSQSPLERPTTASGNNNANN